MGAPFLLARLFRTLVPLTTCEAQGKLTYMNMQSQNQPFTLGVNYWPRQKGVAWWREFDRGEVAEDFAQIQAMGLNAVRIVPLWSDFQPDPDRLDHKMLDRFAAVLDLAANHGLQVLPVLFAGLVYGALWLPAWAVEASAEIGRRIIVNGRDLHHATPQDFYSRPTLIQAQFLLIGELVGYFAQHPALWGWELGQRTAEWAVPPSSSAAQDWMMGLVEASHALAPDTRLVYTLGEPGLSNPLRINDLAEAVAVLGWTVDVGISALAEHPLDADVYRLGLALLRGLAGRETQVMLSAVGVASAPPGEPGRMLNTPLSVRPHYAASESEQAEFVAAAIEAAWHDAATAVWLSSYSDYPERLWSSPPLDFAHRVRTAGLTRADGSEKPVVATLRNLAGQSARGDFNAPRGPRRKLHLDPDAYYEARDERGIPNVADSLAKAVRRWREGGD